jgi:prepilin signal peptidase PulO-like enzyme (type II secretory pathway)
LRWALKKLRLLYLPRMALIITGTSLGIMALLPLLKYFSQKELDLTTGLAIFLLVLLVENFIAVQIERGLRQAFLVFFETLMLAFICYFLATWNWMRQFSLNYPVLIILITILINVFLGKWKGLRLTEYFRFREVIRHVEIPKKK